MKAMRFHAYGGPLQLDDVAVPEVGTDEVLIKVAAAAVNPYDWKVRSGAYKDVFAVTLPMTPGVEAAGIVASVGSNVTSVRAGEPAYGRVSGGYAEYALASANGVAPKPEHLGFLEASAIPVALDTSWSALFDLADLRAGQRVLIHGAAGSVGSVAVELTKWKGAYVVGTASAENLDFVRSLGADEAIDYGATPFESVAKDIDVVFDTVGGETQRRSFATLRKGGVLVSIVSPPPEDLAKEYGVRGMARFGSTNPLTFRNAQHLVEAEIIRPAIRKVFRLEEAGAAEELGQSGHGRGKVVLQVD